MKVLLREALSSHHAREDGSVCKPHNSCLPHREIIQHWWVFTSAALWIIWIESHTYLQVRAADSLVVMSSRRDGCQGKGNEPSSQGGVGKQKKQNSLGYEKCSKLVGKLNTDQPRVLMNIQAENPHHHHFTTRQVTVSGSNHAGKWPAGPVGHQHALLPAECLLSLSCLLFLPASQP